MNKFFLSAVFILSVLFGFSQTRSGNMTVADAGYVFDQDSLDLLYASLHTGNPPQVNACASTNTLGLPYNQNNGQRGIMFDITAINCVTIRCFEANFATGTTGVEIWTRPGTHVGFANSSVGWTLVGTSAAVAGAGANLVTAIPIPVNVVINAGATAAFYITRTTAAGPVMQYTNGTAVGFVYGSDANIQVKDGTGKDYSFGASFTPRRFNGSVFYDVGTTAVPVGPVSGNTPVCSGTVQTFSVAPVGGATSYNWTVPVGSTITAGAGTNSITVTMGANSGNVCVTPVVPCGIVVPSCFAVTIGGALTVTATSTPASLCAGATSQLQATGATTYTWSPAASLSCTNCANPIATPTATTTYSVTGNSSGCVGNATTTVTVNPNPVPVANNAGPFCAGSTITLSSAGGTSYSWAGPLGFVSNVQNPAIPSSTTGMSGVYTVTVTTGTCTASTTTNVTVNALPTITVNSTAICNSQTTATLTANGGSSYAWTAGTSAPTGTTVTANPTTTTQYTVTGTAANGCSNTAVSTVTVNALPVITITNTGPYCPGATIQLNATGGTTYAWTGPNVFSSPAQNPTIANASATEAGTYSATVTDANGCFSSGTTSVTVNTVLAPGIASNSPICEGTNLDLTCSNGVSWSWTGPNAFADPNQNATIAAATPAASGTYSISVTDASGCVGTGTISVVVNPLPVVTVNSATICATFTANLNAGGASSYAWTAGTSSANGANVTASPAATTQYTVTGTDGNGCVNTATSTVTVNALPVVTVNSPNICPGSTANLTANGAATYSWTAGTSSATGANVTATPAATTQYTVTGTDVNNCVSTAVSTVTVNAQLVIDAGLDDTVCIGNNILLNATGPAGTTFTWNPGNLPGSSQSVAAVSSVTYTLSGVDVNGCTGTDSVLITVPATIILNTSSVNTSCFGVCDGQAGVIATPATGPFSTYTYSWAGGTATINSLCAGNYAVTVTNNAGCTSTTTVTVSEPTAVTANASATTNASCNGICDGATTIIANGGSGTYTYNWTPAGFGSNPTNLCAGNYTCTVADGNNCSVPVTVTITEPTAITVTINTVTTICIGQTATLVSNAVGGNGGYVYTWTGGTTPANTATVNASPTVTTTYTLSVTDVNGCAPGVANVTVSLNSALIVTASSNVTICSGATTALSAIGAGGNGVFSYAWSPATAPASGANVNASPAATTVYTVTVTDGCGTPPAMDTVVVTVNQPPALGITTSSASGCAPLCVSLNGSSNPAAAVTNWTFTDGQTANNTTSPNICFTNAGTYGATITVTDVNGCQNTFTNNNLVVVNPVPVPLFSYDPQPVTESNPFVTFTDMSTGANIVTWDWNFGDALATTSADQNPSFDYGGSGTYNVTLTVTSFEGCTDFITQQIEIDPEFNLWVPNAFTPNGNNHNDTFFPKGTGIKEEDYRFIIYNRWGGKIWETDKWSEGWNGEVNGTRVESEVYVWKIFLRQYDGTKKSYVGHVTVVR